MLYRVPLAALVFVAAAAVENVSANIVLTDFSSGLGGWAYTGGGSYYLIDGNAELVTLTGSSKALQLNYSPYAQNAGTDLYRGWVGVAKSWDTVNQHDVSQLTVTLASNKPWRIFIYATFLINGASVEKNKTIYWPNNTYTLAAADFSVTAEQFGTINKLRFAMDTASATNGGGRTGTNPMWLQIKNVELNGTNSIPEPASLGVLALAGAGLLLVRRSRK